MRLHRLESARGFAAVYVVAHHAIPHDIPVLGYNFGFLLRFGQEAVILFFLLSGFVIHYSFSKRWVSTTEFLFNRVCRIFLPLLPVLVLSYVLSALAAGRWIDVELVSLVGNILMLQDISGLKPGAIVEPYMGNQPLWSLSYEWWFYVIYILLMKTVSTSGKRTAFVLLLGVVCALAYYWYPSWVLRVGFYLSIWWCGVLMAQRYLSEGQRHVSVSSLVGVVSPLVIVAAVLVAGAWLSGALFAATRLGTHPVLEIRHFLAAIVFVLAAYGWQALNWRGFSVLLAPFAVVAPISYGIYIAHAPLLRFPELLGFERSSALAFLVSMVAIVVFSWFIELRFYPAVRDRLRLVWFPQVDVVKPKADAAV